jgi:hypothetical protein
MIYKKDNINQLFNYFYNIVDKIIYDIHSNNIISSKLFRCKYNYLNEYINIDYPLTICLGGGGYLLYKKIFDNEKLNYKTNILTYDYDISFSFNEYINKDILSNINKELEDICLRNLKKINFMNLNYNNFKFESIISNDRLHYRIICDTKINTPFHILELSFWLNGKVSDNFTINDFKNNKLILYKNNDLYYYLLPLEMLVKTTLYAIVDFFEKRNFYKCYKYLERIKYIKKVYDYYLNIEKPSKIIMIILKFYKNKIKRKYKIIYDYPFILAKVFVNMNINNNGIIKCIYRHIRTKNNKKIISIVDKYRELCKEKLEYKENDSETTIIDTDDM